MKPAVTQTIGAYVFNVTIIILIYIFAKLFCCFETFDASIYISLFVWTVSRYLHILLFKFYEYMIFILLGKQTVIWNEELKNWILYGVDALLYGEKFLVLISMKAVFIHG